MTLLPIAAPTTPPNGAAAGDVTSDSGDFAALLALVAGIVPQPPEASVAGSQVEIPTPAVSEEPPEAPAEMASAVALLAAFHPVTGDAMPAPAAATPPAPRPVAALPVVPAEAAPGVPADGPPAAPVAALPAELHEIPQTDRPRAEVDPPGRGRVPSRTVPASPVAVAASPALTDTSPAQAPAQVPAPAQTPDPAGPPEDAAVVMPPGPSVRGGRPPVRVPASPTAVDASPALAEAPPAAAEPGPIPNHPVQEDPPGHRIPEKAVPAVTSPLPAPWPGAATRAEALAPVDAPAATPVAPPAIPEQIVSAVVPLHGRGDGRHEVTLELRPADLGTIRVEVSVEHQTVHLTLHAAEPATGRLLSAGLDDLRSALADAGLNAGHVAVSPDGGTGSGRRSHPQTGTESRPADRPGPPSAVPATTPVIRPVAAGRLDLLL